MGAKHTDLANKILMEYSKLPGLTLWKLETGVARALHNDQIIRYGIVGGSDIIGIKADNCPACGHGPLGRFVGVEVKTPNDRIKKGQDTFRDVVLSHGGIYCLARDLGDPEEYLVGHQDRKAS